MYENLPSEALLNCGKLINIGSMLVNQFCLEGVAGNVPESRVVCWYSDIIAINTRGPRTVQ